MIRLSITPEQFFATFTYCPTYKWRLEDVRSSILLSMPVEKYNAIKAHAESKNESLNGFINRAIDETIARDTEQDQAQ